MRPRTTIALLISLVPALAMARRPAAALRDNQLATGSFHLSGRQHGPSIGPAIGTGVLLDRFGSTGRLGLVITNSHNLHWGNTTIFGRSIRSHAVPVDLILRDIGRNLGGIPNRKARATVERLLSRSGVDVRPTATSNQTHTINDLTTIHFTGGTP